MLLHRMVTHSDHPPSAAEPEIMIDVIFVQDSNSNKNSTSVTLCKLYSYLLAPSGQARARLFIWSPRHRDLMLRTSDLPLRGHRFHCQPLHFM